MAASPFRAFNRTLPISLAGMSLLVIAILTYQLGSPQCDPQEAETKLASYTQQGIHGTNHPPSMSNLLWVHVGPRWHALPLAEKKTLDHVVRCAATTIDDRGHSTWQAAYYDTMTGRIVALTSREYGFRLKNSE